MAARSSHFARWQEIVPRSLPRSRLVADMTRRHLFFLAAMVYVAVLVVIYLHTLGEIAVLRLETRELRQERATVLEENSRLIREISPYISLSYIDRMTLGWVARTPETRTLDVFPPLQPVAEERPAAPSLRDRLDAWAQAFHLPWQRRSSSIAQQNR